MDITLKRAQLQERVDTFQKQAANIIPATSGDFCDSTPGRESYVGAEFDGIGEDDGDDEQDHDEPRSSAKEYDQTQSTGNSAVDGYADAEYILLDLPSHLGRDWHDKNAAEDLVKTELRLREGQLNDTLKLIRIALGHKSFLFRHDIRSADSQRHKTCAWAGVQAVESTVQHHARVYTRARKALVDLGASADLLGRYKVLSRQDLTVKTSIIAPQIWGQWNKSLPWFWTMDVRRDTDVGEWMEDCTCFSICTCSMNVTFEAVYRVHWLRAKAQKMQWIEELQCLQVEMESAVRFFEHQEQVWRAKEKGTVSESQPGHAAWAARQSAMWHAMATNAESTFAALLSKDPPPEFAKVLQPQSSI